MISFIRNKISRLDIHTLEVLKKSFSASLVKVIGIIVSLVVSIYLGRSLGAEGLGIINIKKKLL